MALDYFPYAEPSQGDTDHDLFLKIATALYLIQQGGGGGGAPSGAAGGDLSGTYPNPAVAKVDGTTPGTTGLTILEADTKSAAQTAIGPYGELVFTSGTKLTSGADGRMGIEDSTGLISSGLLIGLAATPVFLKGESGTLSIRNAADDGYVDFQAKEIRASQFMDATSHFQVNGTQVVGSRQGAISDPSGGTVEDVEARSAIVAILNILRPSAHGLIST